MKDYWLYTPEIDEAGCVAMGETPEEALKDAERLGWIPEPGSEVQWYVLGEGGTLIVEGVEEACVRRAPGPEVGWCGRHEKEHFLNEDGSCHEDSE